MRSFEVDLERGFQKPVRFKRGDAVNTWGSRVHDLAMKLDKMQMSDEVADTLRDLFEEIGQQGRDAVAL